MAGSPADMFTGYPQPHPAKPRLGARPTSLSSPAFPEKRSVTGGPATAPEGAGISGPMGDGREPGALRSTNFV